MVYRLLEELVFYRPLNRFNFDMGTTPGATCSRLPGQLLQFLRPKAFINMTKKQVILVKNSWAAFRDIDPVLLGEVFYSRLFYASPKLRKMFDLSMADQYKKLIDMLSLMVARLDRIDEITEDIKQLAIRHAAYGVKASHYKLVGEALLWTLEKGLGNDWNEPVKDAWAACYSIIANTMISSADAAHGSALEPVQKSTAGT